MTSHEKHKLTESARRATYLALPIMALLLPVFSLLIPIITIEKFGWRTITAMWNIIPLSSALLLAVWLLSRIRTHRQRPRMVSIGTALLVNSFYILVLLSIVFLVDIADTSERFSIANTHLGIDLNTSTKFFAISIVLAAVVLAATLLQSVIELVSEKVQDR